MGLFSETRSAQSLQSTFYPQEASGTDLVGVTDDLYIQWTVLHPHTEQVCSSRSALTASFLKLFPWFNITSLWVFPPLCPLLLVFFFVALPSTGAFMFWNSLRLGPHPTFLLTLYSLVVHIHYQCFKNLYWLMIPKSESPAQISPWSSDPQIQLPTSHLYLVSLQHLTHSFLQHLLQVWHHLSRSEHILISTN